MTRSSVIFWCDRVMYFALLPVAFFLPISTACIEVGASLCIAAFFIKSIILACLPKNQRDAQYPRSPLSSFLVLPVRIFFFAMLLSVIFSQFPYQSYKGFIGKTVEAVILFFVIIESINSRRRLNWFLSLFTLSALLVSLDGIWQYFFGFDVFSHKAVTVEGRITGPFGHPNDYGSYLITVVVFFVSLLVWVWKTRRDVSGNADLFLKGNARAAVISLGAIVAATALGWTFSRGAWIGFGCAAILLAFLQGKKWYVSIGFLLVFWVIFSLQLGSVRNVSFITDDIFKEGGYRVKRLAVMENEGIQKNTFQLYFEDILSTMSRFNFTGRQVFWGETFQVFKAAPIFGTGLNTYTEAVQRYNPLWTGYYSHNCYLQMLAETGIVGLMSFLWIMFVLTRESWRAFLKMPNGFYRVVLVSLFCGLFGFWVHGAMDTNFYSARLGNLMWVLMGLISAVILLAEKDKT